MCCMKKVGRLLHQNWNMFRTFLPANFLFSGMCIRIYDKPDGASIETVNR